MRIWGPRLFGVWGFGLFWAFAGLGLGMLGGYRFTVCLGVVLFGLFGVLGR